MSTWIISDAVNGQELGTIKNKFRFIGSKIEAEGDFGHYIIEGNFGTRSYTITKDGHRVCNCFLTEN